MVAGGVRVDHDVVHHLRGLFPPSRRREGLFFISRRSHDDHYIVSSAEVFVCVNGRLVEEKTQYSYSSMFVGRGAVVFLDAAVLVVAIPTWMWCCCWRGPIL